MNVFDGDAFTAIELTTAINVVPNRYGLLNAMNLFPARGVRTRDVGVEFRNGKLTLLPTRPVGAPATQHDRDRRNYRRFNIPHIPHEGTVTAEDVANVRAFGSENQLQAVGDVVNEELMSLRNNHAITLEFLRAGALRGLVLEPADGSEILNVFTEMGVAQKVVDFTLGTADTDVQGKIHEISRHMEQNLFGETMRDIVGLCSPAFFDKLTRHERVKEAYQFQQGQNVLRDDLRGGFRFQNVTFMEYVGQASDKSGTVHTFIPDGDCRFIPRGMTQSNWTWFAPADFMTAVNTTGQQVYASQKRLDHDRGIEIHTQSNPLPICLRPQLLVRGHSST